jgi:ankyrin repeat protein
MNQFLDNKDFEGVRKALAENPALANEGIPFDKNNTTKAHPLHRICDRVFSKKYTDDEGVEMAKIFIEAGADINGFVTEEKKDTPLIAASSLNADKVAILYIDRGAKINHAGTHGGTALHWAAWTGRDLIVKRLLQENPEINKRCIDFKGTALQWCAHGYIFKDGINRYHQLECAKMLIAAGADKTIPNIEGRTPIEFLTESDTEFLDLLK